MNKLNDDYNWILEYPDYHLWQTKDIINQGQQFFLKKYSIHDGKIEANIHPSQRLIYEFVLKKYPRTVYEIGFGYANHLINIHKILEGKVKLAGCELLQEQYDNAKKFHDIDKYGIDFTIGDFLEIEIKDKYELVYSNTVLMHMSEKRAQLSIEKMCHISSKYILILDGKLPIDNPVEFCRQFGIVKEYEEYWKIWSDNRTVPMLITKE